MGIIVIPLVAVIAGMFGWLEPHLKGDLRDDIKLEVNEQLKDPIKQLNDIQNDVKEIKWKLEVLDPVIRDLTTKKIQNANNLPPEQVKSTINLAKAENICVDEKTIREIGSQLIKTGERNEDKWSAALMLLDYRSFLNIGSKEIPVILDPVPAAQTIVYRSNIPPGYSSPVFSVPNGTAAATMETGAHHWPIGTNPNNDLKIRNPYLMIEGGGDLLDGMEINLGDWEIAWGWVELGRLWIIPTGTIGI